MTGTDLKDGRQRKGWTQEQAARKLGVSQPYLSLLENNSRSMPENLAHKASALLGLSPTRLPMKTGWHSVQAKENEELASELAALRYPGLSYLKSAHKRNPAEVLLSALDAKNLDARLTEALPWVLLKYADLDWQWLVRAAKVNDLQNKLGFLTNVARRLAERLGKRDTAALLREKESLLEHSRLVREETLCHESLSNAEREWLKSNRTKEAKHWHLLTDLSPEHLTHAL
jgi:transcriptional regulator with XRE-family HTH domain